MSSMALYTLGLIVTPSRCLFLAIFVDLSVFTAIFVMRVYSISQSQPTARRILVLVTAVSHLLVVTFFTIGTATTVCMYTSVKNS